MLIIEILKTEPNLIPKVQRAPIPSQQPPSDLSYGGCFFDSGILHNNIWLLRQSLNASIRARFYVKAAYYQLRVNIAAFTIVPACP